MCGLLLCSSFHDMNEVDKKNDLIGTYYIQFLLRLYQSSVD